MNNFSYSTKDTWMHHCYFLALPSCSPNPMTFQITAQNRIQNLFEQKRAKKWSIPFWHLSSFGRNNHLYIAPSISNVQDSCWVLNIIMQALWFIHNLATNLGEQNKKKVRYFQHLGETEAKLVSHSFEAYGRGKTRNLAIWKLCSLFLI